jgi:type VI secretion system protein
MPLKLRIISDQYKQLGKASSQLFGVSGGKIGRAPDNDWVLPDPDRYVSSHHAKVSFRAGSWILEDTSTNGVFVNDNDIPLSVSGPRKLKDGDRLRFGDYDIVVTIDENNDLAADTGGQPSGQRERTAKTTRSSAQEIDYLRHGTFRNHSRSRTREQMGDDLGEDLDVTGLLVSGSRDDRSNDAVAAFDRHAEDSIASARAPTPPIKPAAAKPTKNGGPASLLDDLLHEDGRSEMPENVTDDWHMTTRRLQKRNTGAAAAAPLLQVVTEPAPTAAPQPKPLPVTIAREPAALTRPEPAVARLEPAARAEPERRRNVDGFAELQAGVEALCRGAGIDPTSLPAGAHASLLTLAGQMLRETVLDLMEALRNRGDQKNRFHVANTAIRPNNNNPLKFSANVEEALRKMLDGHSTRYMGGVDALREAFTDLKNHQAAIDAGMHAALNDLLGRVDPTELQERFDRGLKRNPLLGAVNKTKYWDLYTEFYPLLNQRDARGWPAVFTEEFARAYSEKVEELDNPKRR